MATWNLDPAHCTVEFSVKHFDVSWVKGRFGSVRGTIEFDPADPILGSVKAEIETKSISTANEARDNHLKSKDFFDAVHQPFITFVSTKVEKTGEVFKVAGELMMRGITKPVVLEVKYLGSREIIMGDASQTRAGFLAKTEVHRDDFGVSWDAPAGPGISTVGGQVEISLNIEAVKV